MRKRYFALAMLMLIAVVTGCGSKTESDVTIIGGADGPTSIFLASKNDRDSYTQIDQETAKLMMDFEDGHIIVDVRRQDEFDGIIDWTGEVVTEEAKETSMTLTIDGKEMPVTWEDNASVKELKGNCPLTVNMSMYGGFEQVGSIGQSISRDDKKITTEYGDIVLYSGNQIVVFYGSNSWAYTKLGHIDLPEEELTQLLGNGDVVLEIK